LAKIGLNHRIDGLQRLRLLSKDHLSDHSVIIRIQRLDSNRKSPFKPFEICGTGHCRLVSADEYCDLKYPSAVQRVFRLKMFVASRQTELQREFPIHVACPWLGNSPQVAQQS